MTRTKRTPLTPDEREGIVLAVNSAFRKLKNLYARIVPIFEDYGFTPPSAGGSIGMYFAPEGPAPTNAKKLRP
jgi:hypothetical protein